MECRSILLAASLAVPLLAAPALAADKASAVLKDAQGTEIGTATLTTTPSGVLISLDLTALPAGEHAFHIHAVGKCEPPKFESAGPHFNPDTTKHGLMNPEGPHAGDTIYAWSEVLDKAELPGRSDLGALRLRTFAVKDRACADFPRVKADGSLEDGVVLDMDYWVALPR